MGPKITLWFLWHHGTLLTIKVDGGAPAGDETVGVSRKHGSVNADRSNVLVKLNAGVDTQQHYVVEKCRRMRIIALVHHSLLYVVALPRCLWLAL